MSKYNVGDRIIEQTTGRVGTISEVKPYGRGRQLYTAVFSDGPTTVLEQNIIRNYNIDDPYERCKRGVYETCSKFKVVNTTYKINNSNNNTISSLKASKTIFKEYQFKPLLKFLESGSRRILIADEVGLGKTIEAGHIMMELKARKEFKSALIICPQSLKLKWQTELKEKFGLTFKIYESLNDATEDLRVHPNTARGILNYEKIRIPKKEESLKNTELPSNQLLDYLRTGQRRYGFILCDEAHKMRNSETQTYKGATSLLDFSDSVVFLTATPIMLGEDDLYNLLHLLEPHNFNNKSIFKNLINLNKPFIEALGLLNKRNVTLSEIEEVLTKSNVERIYNIGEIERTETILIYDEYKDIPLYEHILRELKEPDTLSLRAKLQMDISAMSRINNVFSRTRKREIAIDEREKNERNAHKEVVVLSEEEHLLYDEVVKKYEDFKGIIETEFYDKSHQGAKLGLYAVKRMLSSSIIATKLWRESNGELLRFEKAIFGYVNHKDSKFDKLCEIINGVKNTGASKLIVFSIFKFTIKYLYARLMNIGVDCYVIHGDVSEREQIIQQFKNNNKFSILLSNEVGSEGLDMQFCSHMVNYDLPWNPMVIEQRIGRIDRFGQKTPKIHIYNLVVKNSILEVVYDRLLERIGIFKGVIGELEMILDEQGEKFNKLEKEMYETFLTKEEQEAKVNDIAKAMETAKINLDKVEEGLTNTLTNDFYFKNEINKIRSKKLYVTESELLNYISSIIEDKLPSCEFRDKGNGCYYLIFPKSTPNILPNFLIENQPIGEECDNLFRVYIQQFKEKINSGSSFVFTFNQELAFDRKDVDYVNIYNPLILATSTYFKNKINSIGNTFKLKLDKNIVDLKHGVYFISIYVISITTTSLGRKVKSDILVPIVYDVESDLIIKDKERNRDYFGLLQSDGEDLLIQEDSDNIAENTYSNMESDFTDYITDYINEQKKDIKMRTDSQRELYLRQTNEYYRIRKELELKNVRDAEFNIEYLTGKERKTAENILRLAQNRLKMLEDAHNSEIERLNNEEEPQLVYKLISVCKFVVI